MNNSKEALIVDRLRRERAALRLQLAFGISPRLSTFLDETLSGNDPVAFCWQSIMAFLRIGTNHRAFPNPFSRREATKIVSFWLAHPSVVIIEPGERFWEILNDLIDTAQVSGPLMTDASLAALAIEHGATVCTTDRDFTRFPGLKTVDPTSDPN